MSKIHSAILLAAGRGERMRPLSLTTPKPLIHVAGRALIDHGLEKLKTCGIENIIVNAHWLAEQIEQWAKLHPQIKISDERDQLLDTGGGVKKTLPLLGKHPFFILNSDSFWQEAGEPALARMQARFSDDMDGLLLLAPAATSLGYEGQGDFTMQSDGKLLRRPDKQVAPFIYAGACILRPELFANINEEAFSLNKIWDEALLRERLYGLRLDGRWLHVGTPSSIAQAEKALNEV